MSWEPSSGGGYYTGTSDYETGGSSDTASSDSSDSDSTDTETNVDDEFEPSSGSGYYTGTSDYETGGTDDTAGSDSGVTIDDVMSGGDYGTDVETPTVEPTDRPMGGGTGAAGDVGVREEQGVEISDDVEFQDTARDLEQQVIDSTPGITSRDQVRVEVDREQNRLEATLTDSAERVATRELARRERERRQQRFSATGGVGGLDPVTERIQERQELISATGGWGGQTPEEEALLSQTPEEEPSQGQFFGPALEEIEEGSGADLSVFDPASRGREDRAQEYGGGLIGEFLAGTPEEERSQIDDAVQGAVLPVGRSIFGYNEPDTEVTDRLTEGDGQIPFTLTEEERAGVEQDVRQRQENIGGPIGDVFGGFVGGVTGSESAGEFAEGAGRSVGDLASLTGGMTLFADTGIRGASNLPGTIDEYGAVETGEAISDTFGTTFRGATETGRTAAIENPAGTAGRAFGNVASGFAAGRAVQAAPNTARGASIRARGGRVVDFDDVSDPPVQTEGMELPGYTRRAQDDPEVAREEFLEQARSTDIGGDDPVGFHVRSEGAVDEFGGFGRSFEAPEGSSELPGLFQSADLSTLRLGSGESSGISFPSIGLPRARTGSGRVLAERDIDVDVAPTGTRNELGEWFNEEAPQDHSFVRTDSDGGPTPEQEVIAPPGSVFEADPGSIFGVRVGGTRIPGTDRRIGGEIVTGRMTRRRAAGTEGEDVGETLSGTEMARETGRSISESVRRQNEAPEPFAPSAPVGTGSPESGSIAESSEFGSGLGTTTVGPFGAATSTGLFGSEGETATATGSSAASGSTVGSGPSVTTTPTEGAPTASVADSFWQGTSSATGIPSSTFNVPSSGEPSAPFTPSEPGSPYWGGPFDSSPPPSRPARSDVPDRRPDEEEQPAPEPLDPETSQYTNPIVDVFDSGTGRGFFGEPEPDPSGATPGFEAEGSGSSAPETGLFEETADLGPFGGWGR